MIDKIKVTMSITRAQPDISYILAFGVPTEGAGVLDNLRVNLVFPSKSLIIVEPDDFPPGTVLNNAIPGVTLTVEGHPGIQVLYDSGHR